MRMRICCHICDLPLAIVLLHLARLSPLDADLSTLSGSRIGGVDAENNFVVITTSGGSVGYLAIMGLGWCINSAEKLDS